MRRLSLSRRSLLRSALVLPFSVPLAGCASEDNPNPFRHGVASGDPLPDGVILWTRVSGEDSATVVVEWEIATDPEMSARVSAGTLETGPDRDYTVKVDVRGLAPAQTYYYRFRARGASSPLGRTRTAPAGATPHLRFGIASCSNWARGYFHGYRALAGHADLDAVIHLGDYIYEYGYDEHTDVRAVEPPHAIVTLADYRTRYAMYRGDPDLQEVHRQHPFITVWDDHEIANNAYKDGAENHTPETEGPFAERKAAALRAYAEWMPIREQASGAIFRKLAFGDLLDLVMLDTRLHGRTAQAGGAMGAPPEPDPERNLLGDDQATWLEEQLRASTARWKLIGQQVMVGNLVLAAGKNIANFDQWHGYPESRNRFLDFLATSGANDVVILTGDIHSSWANEIVVDPNDPALYDPATGRGSLAVELVTPGITSPGLPDLFVDLLEDLRPENPHVRFVEATRRGFMIVDVTHERTQAAWHHLADVAERTPQTPTFAAAWSVRSGVARLEQDAAAAPSRDAPPPAP
jgi:alkaline phosphatase D